MLTIQLQLDLFGHSSTQRSLIVKQTIRIKSQITFRERKVDLQGAEQDAVVLTRLRQRRRRRRRHHRRHRCR